MKLEEKLEYLSANVMDLGAAVSDIVDTAGGRCQVFEAATIYENPAGEAYEVHGLIRQKYADFNQTVGDLGFPTSDEMDDPDVQGGRMNTFEHGTINWNPDDGASVTLRASEGEGDGGTTGEQPEGGTSGEDGGGTGERDFASEAQATYEAIVADHPALAADANPGGGHSTSNEVFSPEFDRLQRLLVRVNFWSEREEAARLLLSDYARAEVGKWLSYIPDNIAYQLDRIGLSTVNQPAIAAYQAQLKKAGDATVIPSTADFNAFAGTAVNWCAQTQTMAFRKSLQARGVDLAIDIVAWENKHIDASARNDVQAGDYITLIGSATPVTGHVGGVIHREDDVLHYVSGNAGGAGQGQGTVRIDKVAVETPPAGYSWAEACKTPGTKVAGKTNPATPGVVWLINAVKFSDVDFETLDSGDAAALAALHLVSKH